jgi:uncharacterized lipoprotein YehR (DUF1307 family)
MKKSVLLLIMSLMLVLAISVAGCSSENSRLSNAAEGKDDAQKMVPRISVRTIQLAVTALMMDAGIGQLDDTYNEIDTREEVESVTAGDGVYSLSKYLDISSYDLLPAFDIALDGKVTVD